MRTVCEPIFEKPLKDISFGHLLVQLFRTAGRFDMEVQPSLVLLQKTLLNVEGLGRQLYPELDLWETALPYLEHWNSKRLNPFTLLGRVRENLPNWVDQLPQLPQLLIDSATEARQLGEINRALREQQQAWEIQRQRRRRWRTRGGIFSLLLAGLSSLPPVAANLATMPTLALGLGALGLYLLCFRE